MTIRDQNSDSSHLPVSSDALKAARRALENKRQKQADKDLGPQPLHAVIDDASWYRRPEPKEESVSVVIDVL